jgi:methylenetetrahydrofolate reductase (NADPH)
LTVPAAGGCPAVQFEILPFGRALQEAERLGEPARLTVTSSPRLGSDQTIEFAGQLSALGHTVIPHLAARMVRDRAHLERLLTGVEAEGMDELFVIGGDNSRPVGNFTSAREVLELIRERPHGVSTLGIAAYPEGHPLIDQETLAGELERKSRLADYMVTQMTFDAGGLVGWLRQTRASGVDLPVRLGLPGVVDRRRLLEVSVRIGVGPSLSFIRKQRGLRQLLRRPSQTVDDLFDALAPAAAAPELNVEGFHYFTLNQLCDTWSWERGKHMTYKEAENR